MTGGTHVTPVECREMREQKAKGFFEELIAREFDVSVTTVSYHTTGRCCHD